ncbi:hypothetical protein ACLGL1_01200 [Peptococcus simiae]|uniref:hypothetical protein n=1 Tax=Peptococcus simiae TaxID=1643805 RepID=UPI00397EFE53
MRTSDRLGLKLPFPDDFYNIQDFNDNFETLEKDIEEVEGRVKQSATEAIATFDWLAGQPGVTYEVVPQDNGSYDKWLEILTKDNSQIARRTSTENREGWTVEVELTLPGKAKVSQMTIWTETGDVWKGVTA